MSTPITLQADFSLGMKQDVPRHQLPKGSVYSLVDYIPGFGGAPAMKRGGWSRPFGTISGSYVAGVGFASFSGGAQVLQFDQAGNLFTAPVSSSTVTSRGASRLPAHPPTYYRSQSFICDSTGAAAPYSYDGTTLGALSGSPPSGSVSCAYKDHLVLAGSAALPSRIWFSSAGDPTSWDTTDPGGQWLDATNPVYGLASLRSMILVFSEGNIERITGDVIPGVAGSDFRRDPLFAVGCVDAASIAVSDDYVVFANADGVWMTDGSALADLTADGGIKELWQSYLTGYATTWSIAGAIHRGRYIVSVMNGSTFVCSFACEVKRRVWSQLTNVESAMVVATPTGIPNATPACYFADRSSLYVGNLETCFTPSATYKNDGDGTAVLPSFETPFYLLAPGRKRIRRVYLSTYLVDSFADSPSLTVSYAVDLSTSTSYTAISDTIAAGAELQRVPLDVRETGEGIAFKVTQTNASARTDIHRFEMDVLASERSR